MNSNKKSSRSTAMPRGTNPTYQDDNTIEPKDFQPTVTIPAEKYYPELKEFADSGEDAVLLFESPEEWPKAYVDINRVAEQYNLPVCAVAVPINRRAIYLVRIERTLKDGN